MRLTQFYKKMQRWVLFTTFLLPLYAVAMEDVVAQQARALMQSGDYVGAYKLLEPLEEVHAGESDFDYLLGVAGVESGNVTRGVFALERVLATGPNHTDARTEMAKAHFKLGEVESSKLEFQNVLDQKPSQEVTSAIARYVTAIDKSLGLTTTFGGFLGFGLGYDSNVNSASSDSNIFIPTFGVLVPNTSPETSDGFKSISGGLSIRHPVSQAVSVFASVSGNSKFNNSETTFDTSYLDINAGLQYKRFIDTVTFSAQDSRFDVDSEAYRRTYGVTLQWQRNFDDRNQGSLFAQATRLDYAGNAIRDVERLILGAGWAHVFAGDKSPVLFTNAYFGRENARDSQADFLDHHLWGLRLGGQLSMTTKLIPYVSMSYEQREYQAQDPIFLVDKEDKQYEVALGLRYMPARDWVIKPELSYLKNDSNTVINAFDRTMFSVSVRKDFHW